MYKFSGRKAILYIEGKNMIEKVLIYLLILY